MQAVERVVAKSAGQEAASKCCAQNEWLQSYKETNQHNDLPSSFMLHGFLYHGFLYSPALPVDS